MKLNDCPFCGRTPRTKVTRYSKPLNIKPIYWVICNAPMHDHSCFVTSTTSRYDVMRKWNTSLPNKGVTVGAGGDVP